MKSDNATNEQSPSGLRPYLSPIMVIALSFGYAVGWGSFMMPGRAFLPNAGPWGTMLGITIGTVAMLIFALNYHRMALRHQGSGGAFSFAQNSFGEDHGYLVGWFMLLAYISILWANATSVKLLVRFTLGDILQFGFHYNLAGFDIYFGEVALSVLVIVLVGLLCLSGRKLAARLNTVLAGVFIAGVVVCFCGAVSHHSGTTASLAPAFADGGNPLGQIVAIVAMMPWAFVGFEAVTNSSAEFKFPIKGLFAVMTVALIIAALIYGLLALLPVLSFPDGYSTWQEYVRDIGNLDGVDAVPTFCAAKRVFGTMGVAMLSAAMIGGQITGIIGAYIAISRLLYAMADDNILPRWFAVLNKDSAPKNGIIFVMAISAIIPFFGRTVISWPVDVSSIGAAIAFGYTSAAAFKTFGVGNVGKVISGKLAGLIGVVMAIFFSLLLLVPNYISGSTLSAESYLLLAVWCILGFLYYKHVFLLDRNHTIGRSLVVWLSLTIMIIFSSLMWVRQSTFDSVESTLGELAEEAGVKDTFEEKMDILNGSMLNHSMCELALLVVSLSIMVSLFSILRRREQNMAVAKAKAEDINKAKSYFFSTVSHDIRTPLNAIIGFSHMLKDGFKTQEEHNQAVDSIIVSGKTLLKLINDVLDLSKLEAGRMSIEPEPTKCQTLLQEIADSFRITIATQKPELEIRAKIGHMPVLMLDPQRLRQIAFNLMGNAVKFTKHGFIEVRASFTHMPGYNHGTFCMEVEDSGCGISEEDMKRIATPYVQVGTKASRNGGTGLGLAISRQLVTAMGGEMTLSSTLGKGTTFTITIPGVEISSVSEEEHRASQGPSAEEKTVQHGDHPTAHRLLLVDDQKINLMVLKAMLTKLRDFDITTASNGREALQILEDNLDKPFDLVFTDMWMPEMDGEELVEIIRNHPRLSHLPVYVITADVETQKHYADLGFTGILLKPVTIERLHDLLD